MEVRTVDGAAISEEIGAFFGAEHDALVAEADSLLSVGRANEATDSVTRLRLSYPQSPQTARLVERLKVVSQADTYWRKQGGNNDFLSLFGQASTGAFTVGAGVALAAVGGVFTLFGAKAMLLGEFASGLFQVAIGITLLWACWAIIRKGQGRA
ncbi:MAG: hypothetical protein QM758_22060 [Armatimonas sp.]